MCVYKQSVCVRVRASHRSRISLKAALTLLDTEPLGQQLQRREADRLSIKKKKHSRATKASTYQKENFQLLWPILDIRLIYKY